MGLERSIPRKTPPVMANQSLSAPDFVRFGVFDLDLRAGELWRNGGGDRVLLPEQPFRILAALVRRPGELVTREDLRHELWPDDTFVDFEHGLNSAIKRLREVLGDSATAPRYIETIPRRGYRFIAQVVPLNGQSTDTAGEVSPKKPSAPPHTVESSGPAAAPSTSQPRAGLSRLVYALAACLLVVALLAAVGLVSSWRREPPTIAVLPFTNLSADPESELFVDGLTDEIIQNLAVIQGLEVRSRTSSFAFKDKPRNLRAVGEQLGATLVVEGSVVGSGTKKHINAQLVEVAGDVPLWAGQFDRDIQSSADLFVVLDEISRAIVNKLRLTLGRGQRRYDLDLNTYELSLKGRALLAQADIPDLEKAAELFQQVLAIDPAFAPAHAGLANAYALMSEPTSSQMSFEAAHAILRQAAFKARELDPLLAEAHAAMGWVYSRELDWANAERSFQQALELNPSLTNIYRSYSISTLQPLGKLDEALRILQVALKNDPLSLEMQREIGHVHMLAGRYTDAIEAFKRVRAVDPEFPFADTHLFRSLIFAGRSAEAMPLLERLDGRNLGRFNALHSQNAWAAQGYVKTGRRSEAEAMAEGHDGSPSGLAFILAALGENDRALDALERMALVEPHHVPRMLVQPEMAALRGDPRFAALRRRFKLPIQ